MCKCANHKINIMWSLPLFLYASSITSDTALLPQPPSAYLPSLADAGYALVSDEPVAFAHTMEEDPKYPLVTLKAYWSEERSDFQTSVWSKGQLNKHGGDYVWVADVGYIASYLSPGVTAHQYVPLLTSYDDNREDAGTAPLSYEDLNLLAPLNRKLGFELSFRAGHREGFVSQAACTFCNVSMSEAFPSAGGADCAYECARGSSCMGSKYVLGGTTDPAMMAFDSAMRAAGDILKQFGDVTATTGSGLHMSMNYFCCYSEIDQMTIRSVLSDYEWPQVNITFDKPVWRVDSDDSSVDHYSIIVMANEKSQKIMEALVADVENKVREAGIDIHVPRADQEPFHSTLGVVNGTTNPCQAAINAVVSAFPPGSWTSKGPLSLQVPDF